MAQQPLETRTPAMVASQRSFDGRRALVIGLVLFACLAACTDPRNAPPSAPAGRVQAASTRMVEPPPTAPVVDKTRLKLEDIEPRPTFPEAKTPLAADAPHEPDRRAMRQLRRGKSRFDEQLWAEAITALEKALQFDPQLNQARLLLARASLRHGNFGLASSHLQEVLESQPGSLAAHQLLGEIAYQQKKPDEAIRSFRLAIMAAKDAPKCPEVVLSRLSLALALEKEGYIAAAAQQLEAYLDLVQQPTPEMEQHLELKEMMVLYRGKAAVLLGDLRSQLDEHESAVDAFRRALQVQPDNAGLRRKLVYALARAGREKEALKAARQWMADFADDVQGLELLENVCNLLGRQEQYDAELAKLAEDAQDPAMRVQLARLLMKRGNTARAAEILEKALTDEVVGPPARYLLAELYAGQNRIQDAYGLIVDALRSHPDEVQTVRLMLARGEIGLTAADFLEPARLLAKARADDAHARYAFGLLLLMNDLEDRAIAELEAAARLDGKLGDAFAEIAGIRIKQKRWTDALAAADAAIANGVRGARLYLAKGLAHDALDETEDAETALLDAFRIDRSRAAPLFHLALAAERRGQVRRCEQFYRRICDDVDPRFVPARERLVRLYVNTGKVNKAREYFSDFHRLGLKGAAADRCRAMLSLTASKIPAGEMRLGEYLERLRKIAQEYPNDHETYLDMAKSFFAVNDFAKALQHTARALKILPDDIPSRELKADLLAKRLRFEDAAAVVRSLLTDRPRDINYLQQLIEYANNEGDYGASIELLQDLLARKDLKDRHQLFTTQLITVQTVAKQYDDAVRTAKKWFDDSPDDKERRRFYSVALVRAKRFDEAVQFARQLLEDDPANRELQINLLTQLRLAQRCDEGRRLVLSYLHDDPFEVDLNGQLIQLSWAAKAWDDAIDIAQTGAERSQDRAHYENWLGRTYRLARRFDEAVDFYREKADILETNRAYRAHLVVLIEAERYDEAEQVVNKIMRPLLAARDKGRAIDIGLMISMRNFLVEIYQNTKREPQAVQQLETIHKLDPNDPLMNNNLGYTWAEAGVNLARAEKMIRYAMSQNPRSSANLDSLGWVLYKKGKVEEGIPFLRRAILMATPDDDPVIRDHLADALYRTGKADEAREQWQQALELTDPKRDPPPAADERILHGLILAKLKQLADGDRVSTAEVVGDEPATKPAAVEP